MASNQGQGQDFVLQGILATLQRLEDRLDTIEFTISHTGRSPDDEPESWAHESEPAWQQHHHQQQQHEDPQNTQTAEHQAALYARSLSKLRNRFEFADDSFSDLEAVPQQLQPMAGRDADCISLSVYSRPLSRAGLLAVATACEAVVEAPDQDVDSPLPQPLSPATVSSTSGQDSDDDRSSGARFNGSYDVSRTTITPPSSIGGGSTPPLSRRETIRSARKMVIDRFFKTSSLSSAASHRSSRRSSHESQHHQPYDYQSTQDTYDTQSTQNTRHQPCPDPKTESPTPTPTTRGFNKRVGEYRVGVVSFVQDARDKAWSCVLILPKATGCLGRFMMDQQLRRLDARA